MKKHWFEDDSTGNCATCGQGIMDGGHNMARGMPMKAKKVDKDAEWLRSIASTNVPPYHQLSNAARNRLRRIAKRLERTKGTP